MSLGTYNGFNNKRNDEVRRDMDICLYSLTDTYRELKEKGK